MFARIAGRYDLLNRLLSMGIDRAWRARLLALAGDLRDRTAVDVCCGTGDVALLLERAGARVVGVDFTPEMLARARHKGAERAAGSSRGHAFVQADALALPLADASADLATIAFGIRNVADRTRAWKEMARVLRPGGRLVVLEFGPTSGQRMGLAFKLYFRSVVPGVGRLVSGDREAYRYLPESVAAWPGPEAIQREIEAAGFRGCGHRALSAGIAYLHWGSAPPPGESGSGGEGRNPGA